MLLYDYCTYVHKVGRDRPESGEQQGMAHAKHCGGSGLQLLDAWLLLILWEVLGEDPLVPGKDVWLSEGPLVHALDFLIQIFGGLVHGGPEGVVGKVQAGVHVADVSDQLSLG